MIFVFFGVRLCLLLGGGFGEKAHKSSVNVNSLLLFPLSMAPGRCKKSKGREAFFVSPIPAVSSNYKHKCTTTSIL